jgi:hypothetical protein
VKKKKLYGIVGALLGFMTGLVGGGFVGFLIGGNFLGGLDIYEHTGFEGYELAAYIGAILGAVVDTFIGIGIGLGIYKKTRT